MPVFVPLIEPDSPPELVAALDRIGPSLLDADDIPTTRKSGDYYALLPPQTRGPEQVVSCLDRGALAAVVSLAQVRDVLGQVPADRLVLLVATENASAVSDKIRDAVGSVILKAEHVDLAFISGLSKFFPSEAQIYVWSSVTPTPRYVRELREANAIPIISSSRLTLGESDATKVNVTELFLAPLVSDRTDRLFPTVISSQLGKTLGLVYSSKESVAESIISGKGVYHSRKHGLWRKGETSGATQEVVAISIDCDADALEFKVKQHGSGFCHKGSVSCFGHDRGLSALEKTLQSRRITAPEASYTRRLFNDPELLNSKLLEEARELCEAEEPEDVAFEAADLIYFALVKCVAKGVTINDIESSLDLKARKLTRRPGNAKTPCNSPAHQATTKIALSSPDSATDPEMVSMRKFAYCDLDASERASLLKRPVLNSATMIDNVRPLVDDVRHRGNKALIDFAAKFDKAQLTEPMLYPPFGDFEADLSSEVKCAIDVAYDNIRRFHLAQLELAPLRVETMPGVVCSRFAKPISKVGLYVPGGTAILPSTALMLGVPAQVAGCEQIVLASPPRSDGTVSPEVRYVAQKVGASSILLSGGAQAIAALAYGTETVPKVDKILGPGNQWVTAAKMFVQNDTDALVSIDMPAGPSEVLVIADSEANPAFVAADLLSQAEHGADSQVVLVAIDLSNDRLRQIEEQVDRQARTLPRFEIIKQSIQKSLIVQVENRETAARFSNDYAPEHLILHVCNASDLLGNISNAGSVFVGPWSPESCGDYASGTNHTLPTNGYAKQFSGVNTLSFQKHITSQEITADGLRRLGPTVMTLADCEGLQAHANAVRVRLQELINS